jgi:uncharacterized membrane protein
MSTTLKNYASAIVAGNIAEVAATLSAAIKVRPPGANQAIEVKEKAAMMLSAVAPAIAGFTMVRTYDAGDGWHAVLLEGLLDGTPVQFIDQVHIGENDLIDHVDIFLRPASMGEILQGKVGAEIKRRTGQ